MKTYPKKTGESTSKLQVLDLENLNDIINRAGSGPLPEADRAKLSETIETLAWLQQELTNKDVTLARLRSLFGLSSSEKTKNVLRKTSGDGSTSGEGTSTPKKPKEKAKGHGRNAADAYKGADRIEVAHDSLKSGEPCPECPSNKRGKVYMLGKPKTLVRVTGRTPLHATVYEMERLRCNLCGKVFHANAPPGIGDKKYDATAAGMIALLKYGTGVPFNRLARLQKSLGILLPDATQWDIVSEASDEIMPVHQELIRQGAQGRVLHNDDTSMRILELRKEIDKLKESGETDRTGIFTTAMVSVLADGYRVALFFTGRQHSGENMADVLRLRAADLDKPIQMCDALNHNLPKDFETLVSNCLAHARRKFVEVVESFPEECRHVLEALRHVYVNDATARKRELSDGERLAYHQDHSTSHMDGLEHWMHEQIDQKIVEPNSGLGKAITYMTKRWDRFTLFLRVPGAPLDNNIAERALKKAILNRKNGLFYKTENGARVGDLFMSLIHTAELVGANPLEYLTALLKNSAAAGQNPSRWMPWNYTRELPESAPADQTATM